MLRVCCTSNLVLAMLGVYYWLISSAATPKHFKIELLQLLLSQELFDATPLHPLHVSVEGEPFQVDSPLLWRQSELPHVGGHFEAVASGGGMAAVQPPTTAPVVDGDLRPAPTLSTLCSPGLGHVGKCVPLCRSGEDMDKVRAPGCRVSDVRYVASCIALAYV